MLQVVLAADYCPTKNEIKLILTIQEMANSRLFESEHSLHSIAKALRDADLKFYVTKSTDGENSYYYCEKCGKLINMETECESLPQTGGRMIHSPCPKDPIPETTEFK